MSLPSKLREALEASGLSVSELGRRLAGPSATRSQVDNQRSQVHRWLRGGSGISDENAERLAGALGLPLDYFKEPRPTPDEVDRIRQRVVDLLREVDDLRRRLDGEAA